MSERMITWMTTPQICTSCHIDAAQGGKRDWRLQAQAAMVLDQAFEGEFVQHRPTTRPDWIRSIHHRQITVDAGPSMDSPLTARRMCWWDGESAGR